jgi:hypothetical protein
MSRRITLAMVISLVLAVLIAGPALAAKSYYAERFDVLVDIQPDGSLYVTETVVFRFDGGPFTYVFRDIARSGTDAIRVLDASMDGTLLPAGGQAGQVEIGEGDPIEVNWHFAPTSDTKHTFVLRYRVEGAIRTGAADTLVWYAIPESHGYKITSSTITLNYPQGQAPLEAPGLDRDFHTVPTERGVQLTTSDISEDESVILTARFPSNSLAASTPAWQARQAQTSAATRQAILAALIAGLAALLLGALGFIAIVRANRRDLNISVMGIQAIPPADLRPALVGKLTGTSDGSLGSLFDLGQRGVLEVQEEKGFLGTKKYNLVWKDARAPLSAHEQALLEAIFKGGRSEVNMSEIPTRLSGRSRELESLLEEELQQRGLFDPERKKRKTGLVVGGMLLMVLGVAAFIVGIIGVGLLLTGSALSRSLMALLAGAGGGAFVLSFPVIIYAAVYSPLTPAGEEQKRRWLGFRAYLNQVARGKEPAISTDFFERYLAFAGMFGLGTEWARYFQKLGGAPLPAWFHALPGSEGDFGAMVAAMTAFDASASSASAGGGGASGGGSSGAG